jgi:hypothetical protein
MPDVISTAPADVRLWVALDVHKLSIEDAPDGVELRWRSASCDYVVATIAASSVGALLGWGRVTSRSMAVASFASS